MNNSITWNGHNKTRYNCSQVDNLCSVGKSECKKLLNNICGGKYDKFLLNRHRMNSLCGVESEKKLKYTIYVVDDHNLGHFWVEIFRADISLSNFCSILGSTLFSMIRRENFT